MQQIPSILKTPKTHSPTSGPDELVIFVTTFQLAVLGSPVNLPLVPLVPLDKLETRQRPSGVHLLLLVDDVETWNSKLKEMEGGVKKKTVEQKNNDKNTV